MAASTKENVKINKQERKLIKKQNKAKYILLKHEGIGTSDNPTQILCINNGGLDAGMTYHRIKELFSPHGTVEDVIMLSQKPYCFVCFSSIYEAEAAYKALNGCQVDGSLHSQQSRFYISFVNQVPADIGPSSSLPPGLILIEDFVTPEYEQKLLQFLNWDEEPNMGQKCLKHRNVQHFGYEFKYGINNVDPKEPLSHGIPVECQELLNRVLEMGVVYHFPDQLTINQYAPGQGIPPHVDTPSAFEDGIMSLSLGSQTVMDFRHPDGRHLSVLLPARSLLVMTGESRYTWSHGITPRKSDITPTGDGNLTLLKRGVRTSFTFRKLKILKDQDVENLKEDSKGQSCPDIPHSEEEAIKLEQLHVHEVYDEIADHFSGTRYKAWPKVADFVTSVPAGSLLADIGCGNGKYLGLNKSIFAIGSDRSSSLSSICQERQFQVFVGDVMSLPIRSNTFDVCLCIAVIHHLSTEERRRKAISELVRILRYGGQVLIYVWAMEQKQDKVKSKYLKDSKVQKQVNNPNKEFCDENQNKPSEHQDIMTTPLQATNAKVYTETVESADNAPVADCKSATIPSPVAASGPQVTQCGINYLKYLHEVAENENNENLACASSMQAASNSDPQPTCQNSDRSQDDASAEMCNSVSHLRNDNPCGMDEKKMDTQCLPATEVVMSMSDQNQKCSTHNISSHGITDTSKTCHQISSENVTADAGTSKKQAAESQMNNAAQNCSTKLPVHVNRTPFKQQDMLVPWQLKGNSNSNTKSGSTFHRFYHVFKEGELEGLCAAVKECRVVKSYYDQGNWCIILEKTM
ncbi:alkylated DNA repair protein alkB homolog 8-like [Gigantopelta aegis]|uniref:alkylated DNA repair protein alkB homolog 8-like n=1 Tax=Gigantopelta aegis TaxID=1735272 RepID=UPI001B88760E|nr:alkylated DNA repair protein alkB homolog 8-like [Gigantopelta aegis]